MQKLTHKQKLDQKLTPQQIQFIKLLQVPTIELDTRINAEIEDNPALEYEDNLKEEKIENNEQENGNESQEDNFQNEDDEKDFSIEDYLQDDYLGYKMQGDGNYTRKEDYEAPMPNTKNFQEQLLTQLGYLDLNETEKKICKQLIGSMDEDGYIRREMSAIVDDLAFLGIETTANKVEQMLFKVQSFDPAGVGARDLRECLLLQLERKDPKEEANRLAYQIIDDCFEMFTKKHYSKIAQKLHIDDDMLKLAVDTIIKLNPKPGNSGNETVKNQMIVPDFSVKNQDGLLMISLNSKNAPNLTINASYNQMLTKLSSTKDKKNKEALNFVKQKIDGAKWFIDAIARRQETLLITIETIVEYQKTYFLTGDESTLKPMILKDIADKIAMDLSTVSRIVNSKYVETDYGVFLLKHFFAEAVIQKDGEDVSNREVKIFLKEIIDNEPKSDPFSDEKLEKLLQDKGYNIARRTVAKYREQLNIPVARLRKELN